MRFIISQMIAKTSVRNILMTDNWTDTNCAVVQQIFLQNKLFLDIVPQMPTSIAKRLFLPMPHLKSQ